MEKQFIKLVKIKQLKLLKLNIVSEKELFISFEKIEIYRYSVDT